ncbi:hypothetical protein MPSEU_000762200 [Mayamaea pseudoterrestris]|nr:hypothetical protein MPSEU_000762200 [Mayamaea pseudoterrestris]
MDEDGLQTPLSSYLEDLLAGCRRVKIVHDQCKTSQALKHTFAPKHKRRSMDMICRSKDTNPCRPNRRTSMEMTCKVSIQPPRMPTRRGSCGVYTPATVARPGIPHKEKAMMQLVVSPMA